MAPGEDACRENVEAAEEFVEYLTIGATVPMFVAVYRRLRPPVRAALVPKLLSVSYGEDRHGDLVPDQGAVLRAAVADLLSVWLTREGEFTEATAVLRPAPATPPPPAAPLDRTRKRLNAANLKPRNPR